MSLACAGALLVAWVWRARGREVDGTKTPPVSSPGAATPWWNSGNLNPGLTSRIVGGHRCFVSKTPSLQEARDIVVFEAGCGNSAVKMAKVYAAINAQIKDLHLQQTMAMVAYDRAGYGGSASQRHVPRTASTCAHELVRLLDDLGALPPEGGLTKRLVLVGYSLGGLIVRHVANDLRLCNGLELMGIVLIDPTHEIEEGIEALAELNLLQRYLPAHLRALAIVLAHKFLCKFTHHTYVPDVLLKWCGYSKAADIAAVIKRESRYCASLPKPCREAIIADINDAGHRMTRELEADALVDSCREMERMGAQYISIDPALLRLVVAGDKMNDDNAEKPGEKRTALQSISATFRIDRDLHRFSMKGVHHGNILTMDRPHECVQTIRDCVMECFFSERSVHNGQPP